MSVLANQEADESDFINGTIEKKRYRRRWIRNVKKIPKHPFNHGIHMDTHHIISAEGVKVSELGDSLVSKGYDINQLSNLVGFPATLPGACQLRCQLHRGDHTFSRPREEPYHDHISNLLTRPALKKKIKECYGKTKVTENASEIHKLLDPVSRKILKQVNKLKMDILKMNKFYQLPLTKISHYFVPDGPGCCGKFDVNDAYNQENTPCQTDRLHYRSDNRTGIDKRYQSSGANEAGNSKVITYKNSRRWIPKVGQ